MTDDITNRETGSGSSHAGTSDDTFAWTEPEHGPDRGEKAREWLAQLQAMIEQLATQAAPVVREVGAKAAELAAKAGEKAGPVAEKAAEATGRAGHKLAERSRELAAELRKEHAARETAEAMSGTTHDDGADTADPMHEDRPAGVS